MMYRFLSCLLLALLVSCGGGGGSSGTSPFGGGSSGGGTTTNPEEPVVIASNLVLSLSDVVVNNTASTEVTATVTASNASGQALAGIPVSFSVNNNAVVSFTSTTTGVNGQIEAKVRLGGDLSNRVVTVTATSGSVSRSASFQVRGAELTATAPATADVSTPVSVRFLLIDANRNGMPNQTVSITGTGLSPAQGVTSAVGDYTYQFTAPATAGSVTIAATAGGATASSVILVGGGSIDPVTPGSVVSASVLANPTVVSVNAPGSTQNQVQIRAQFVGALNAPIQNVRVRFDLDGDANNIGGTFASGTQPVYSNANGIAATAYYPGTRASPTNGLTVRACWNYSDFAIGTCPNAVRTTLTVASDALSVTLGTDNTVGVGPSGLTYTKRFVALVVDSAGRAKPDVQVSYSLDLEAYKKGQYVLGAAWGRSLSATAGNTRVCANEDVNRNGTLEGAGSTGEDSNSNGQLDPRKADVTITHIGSQITDANGAVVLQIEYPKSLSTWVDYLVTAAASGISGTEARYSLSGELPAPATEFTTTTVAPSFYRSPYGTEESPYVTKTLNGTTIQYHSGVDALFCSNPR